MGIALTLGITMPQEAFANQSCYVDDSDIRGNYMGACVDGKAHGLGESKGKDHYKGEFKEGKTHGKGVYTWANGSKYDGERKDNKRHGLGKLTFVKGDNDIASWQRANKGEWRGDVYVVQGRFYNGSLDQKMTSEQYANALKEQAEKARKEAEEKAKKARKAELEQKAKAEWTLTETHQCKVRNIHSNHIAKWSGGCKDGYVEGVGTLEWYKDDKLTGTYIGNFSQGNMHSRGVYTWANGDKYDGSWQNNQYHGTGVHTLANGEKYDGEWQNGKRDGQGVQVWADGSKYSGGWQDGNWHGLGKLTLVQDSNSISGYSLGEWQGNTYIVQGEFANGKHILQCEPNQKACDKARAEQEKRERERREREYRANLEACKKHYVGEILSLKAPYQVSTFLLFSSTKYDYLPFKVVGVGQDRMTVEAVYTGGIIGDISSANIACNATQVY